MKIEEKYRNRWFDWRGGGYDGCIWEPNCGFVDKDGNWIPLVSTGIGALESNERFIKAIESADSNLTVNANDFNLCSGVDGVPLDDIEAACKKICEWYGGANMGFALEALARLEAHVQGVVAYCSDCGAAIAPVDHGFLCCGEGNGGIGMFYRKYICDDCYCSTICPHCGDAVLPNPRVESIADFGYDFSARFFYDWIGVCEYCSGEFLTEHKNFQKELAKFEQRCSEHYDKLNEYLAMLRNEKHRNQAQLENIRAREDAWWIREYDEAVAELRNRMRSAVKAYFGENICDD